MRIAFQEMDDNCSAGRDHGFDSSLILQSGTDYDYDSDEALTPNMTKSISRNVPIF